VSLTKTDAFHGQYNCQLSSVPSPTTTTFQSRRHSKLTVSAIDPTTAIEVNHLSILPMSLNVTVIGIGAMGGGMARALLQSNVVSQVVGYDRSAELVQAFFEEAHQAGKAPISAPTCPRMPFPARRRSLFWCL
jgi:hypothetical protein